MMVMKTLSRWLFVVALLANVASAAAPASTPEVRLLPTTTLTVKGHNVTAEVAATASERATGLMYRFSLRPDHGMVFVFARSEPLGFWMRNTYVPLSIAFVDAGGRILNIEDMAPQTDETHWSKGPALYALEMRKGWFRERGIGSGDRVEGLPKPGKE